MKVTDELKAELIYSLPSRRILDVVSNLAIRNPYTKELIFLKQRPCYENTPIEEYIEYNEKHDMHHDYRELIAEHVIIDISLLHRRAKISLFEEWQKANPPRCNTCKTEISISLSAFVNKETLKLKDVDGEKVKGLFCKDCVEQAWSDLIESRFAEKYNGRKIYCKDGKYFPYWNCAYYFKTVEECRVRIDYYNISIVKRGLVDLKGAFS
ncbi:hypothetical protein [Bacillus cereus]|uniref:hypothetical protein n=1 Tax=Bacillus cereus TaxID=1396 RepID=UPI000330553B|nr:hypothetical protein [Bacillus cereus]EOO44197.1 hypothetical protein ICK_06454 [Bacillus cereus BAG1X2-2]EOP00404.1 hypothetical protein ICO_06360 [Bacillus cereus BAG2O-1]